MDVIGSSRYPDKSLYKPTVTSELRSQIAAVGSPTKRYLEVGCDVGFTLATVAPYFGACLGLDTDPMRIASARSLGLGQACQFIVGDRSAILDGQWDVVLLDAAHDYDGVRADFDAVVAALRCRAATIFVHDYGLVGSGVKQLARELAKCYRVELAGKLDEWNPRGSPIDGPEAIRVEIGGS